MWIKDSVGGALLGRSRAGGRPVGESGGLPVAQGLFLRWSQARVTDNAVRECACVHVRVCACPRTPVCTPTRTAFHSTWRHRVEQGPLHRNNSPACPPFLEEHGCHPKNHLPGPQQGPQCPQPPLPGRGSLTQPNTSSARLPHPEMHLAAPPPPHGHGASVGPLAEPLPQGGCGPPGLASSPLPGG